MRYIFPAFKATLLSITLFFFYSAPLSARQSVSGNLRNYNAVLTSGNQEYLIGHNRLTLDLNFDLSSGQIYISNEVLNTYSRSANNALYDLGEAYVDLYLPSMDIRIGKQVVTYGRADGVFITDIVSPLDLSEFLTQPVEVLKVGIPAVKATLYQGSNYLELLVSPIFQSNSMPEPGSRWFPYSRFSGDTELNITYPEYQREHNWALFQGALRYAIRENLDWDLDLMALWWSESAPSFFKEYRLEGSPPEPSFQLYQKYLRRFILAYSGSYLLSESLIFKSESAFHFQRYFDYLPMALKQEDLENLSLAEQIALNQELSDNEDGFLKQKPWLITMGGLQYEISDWQLSTQFIYERIFDYQNEVLQNEHYYYSTLRIQNSFLRDKLTVSAFGRYNFKGPDFWVNPQFTYELMDGVEAGSGLQLFSGKNNERFYGHFSFQDYASNSFGYFILTAYF